MTGRPAASGERVTLDDYAAIVGAPEMTALRAFARPLEGRRVRMVSAAPGGATGAAMLARLVPLLTALGLTVRWDVVAGGADFPEAARAFRHALQGEPAVASSRWRDVLAAAIEAHRCQTLFDDDIVVVHDAELAGLVASRALLRASWLWRGHADLTRPRPEAWTFLEASLNRYDAVTFPAPTCSPPLRVPVYVLPPVIDPLADINRELEPDMVRGVVERLGIDPDRPIVSQISRFDRARDPVGAIAAFRIVRRFADCQLVVAGRVPDDGPDGSDSLREAREAAAGDPDIHLLVLPATGALTINALQRASTIVLHRPVRGGFGLAAIEALWKGRPVVAADVGGLPAVVIHNVTGLVAHSIEGAAYHLRYLLANPPVGHVLGERGRRHVAEHFLITRLVKSHLLLFLTVGQAAGAASTRS